MLEFCDRNLIYVIKIIFSVVYYSKNFIALEFVALELRSNRSRISDWNEIRRLAHHAPHNATIRGLFIEEWVLVYMPLNKRDQFNPAHGNEVNILMDRE